MRWLLAWFWVVLAMCAFNVRPAFAQDENKTDKKEAHPEKKDAQGDADDEETEHKPPPKMKIGVQLESVTGFDAAKGTYSAEFIMFFHCDGEPCKPEIDAVNAKANLSKPEKLVNEKTYKVYKYKAEFNAMVDMADFPFDEHVLPIVLEDRAENEDSQWELDEKLTNFDAEKCKVPAFEPTQWLAAVVKDDVGGGTKVTQFRFGLEIKRKKFLGFLSNLLPPMVMAIFIMGATLFMKPKGAQGRLGGISGSLLALVMFHKGALPPGGSLTLLDKFMIATYFVYVVNILLTVVMLRADDKKQEKKAEIAYLIAWGAVPGFALLAWTLVFSGLV